MIENIALLLVGLAGLFYGGNWLVRGASNLALSFGVSVLVIGMTIVALGTSMPELVVSVQAALAGKSDLAIGNVIGSNIANVGLILGATGLITPLAVQAILLRREIPLMIAITAATFFVAADGQLSRLDGALLMAGFALFNLVFYLQARREQKESDAGDSEQLAERAEISRWREFACLALGIAALVIGSRLMVEGAVNLARMIGISELVIAITLVALGTSLPELAASLSAAYRKETDLAIGNIVGSNIANLLLILGATSLLQPIPVDRAEVQVEFLVMIAFAALLIPFARKQRLGRRASGAFLIAYIAFVVYSLSTGGAPNLLQ